jgi:hypothetical protein
MTRRSGQCAIVLSVLLLGWWGGALQEAVATATCVRLSAFNASDSALVGRVNIKLADPSRLSFGVTPSLVLRARGAALAMWHASACENPPSGCPGDALLGDSLESDAYRVAAALDSLSAIEALKDSSCAQEGLVSLCVIDPLESAPRVFACTLDSANADAVLSRLTVAFASDDSVVAALQNFACLRGLARPWAPVDVSNHTAVSLGPIRYRRSDGLYVGTVSVTNTSGQLIAGPARLVMVPTEPVYVVGGDGEVPCNGRLPGAAYVSLPVGAGLGPGATVVVRVVFRNDDRLPIRFEETQVLTGVGE